MNTSSSEKTAVDKAQEYYDSLSADEFYFKIWGGEHIHVGIYHEPDESIKEASPRIVHKMAGKLNINDKTKVLDLGSGYGGAARYLTKTYNCEVTCLNLSETQNEKNEKFNKDQGLDDNITIVEGSFEDIPFPNGSYDVIWSQDAIVHSANRERVIEEVDRVLKDDGEFIFTDLMQAYDCPKEVLKPVLDRIHLDSLGSFGFYVEQALKLGLQSAQVLDLSDHLTTHYRRVKEETQKRYDEMVDICGKEYIDTMIQGLDHWVNAGNSDYLSWGIMHFTKKEA